VRMSWVTGPLLGFDTETTGIDVRTDRIVTAALVRRDDTGTSARTWLLAPETDIPSAASAIHGITTDHARSHGRPPSQALEEIAAALADAVAAGTPVVAFNATFDLDLLDAELRRHGLRTLAERLGREVAPVLDPLVLDRWQDPDRRGPRRLVDLCAYYGVTSDGQLHTAEVDVLATLDVLAAIVERFPHLAAVDVTTVHEHQVVARRAWADEAAARRARRALERRRAEAARPLLARWASRGARVLRSLARRLGAPRGRGGR
jgi:DNA polymerase-3 subunit epsilon